MNEQTVIKTPARSEVPANYKWQLEHIFPDISTMESAFTATKELIEVLAKYEGHLDEPNMLMEALRHSSKTLKIVAALNAYTFMRHDEDNTSSTNLAYHDRSEQLAVLYDTAQSFIKPGMLALDESILHAAMADPENYEFVFMIREVLREREHTLSPSEERLIAMTGEMGMSPNSIYNMFSEADMKFPNITDESGNLVELTHGKFISLMMNRDRRVRKDTFEALYATYKAWGSTISAMYSAQVKADIFYSKTAKHTSCLEAKLFPDNVPVSVYENLISAMHHHFPALHKYLLLRKEIMALDDVHMYDLYTPITADIDIELDYQKGYALMCECLAPLGDEYVGMLRKAYTAGWIDAFENIGKGSGAYSYGVYGVHPYVLLNYQPHLEAVMTIAHEMGHAMHTWYANANQPFELADYSLFVAEVASTVNEMLMTNMLLTRFTESHEQAFLLNHLLEQFRTTVFRQTMFAEFEKLSHEMAETGTPLTVDSLCDTYMDLNKQYYASAQVDELIKYEWMRIPHFYRSFYVYKYATSFSAAVAISQAIMQEGQPAVDRLIAFLKIGGSMHPIDALKIAGVDMSTPKPVEDALCYFEEVLEKFEKIVKEI